MALCEKGDKFIVIECEKKYKDEKDLKKGIAFSTSRFINNCTCPFLPSKNDPDYELKAEDVVNIDGFIALLGSHIGRWREG